MYIKNEKKEIEDREVNVNSYISILRSLIIRYGS